MLPFKKPDKVIPTHVNLERSAESVADQYDDIVDGLQKEGTQNAWDARMDKETAIGWQQTYVLSSSEKKLKIEDWGTTGMNKEKWSEFHSLWDSKKGDDPLSLGNRGQGKYLFIAAGECIVTETIDESGMYRCRYADQRGSQDFENIKKRELYHQGTLVTIFNLKPHVLKGLQNHLQFIRDIQLTWWEIIQDYGAKIQYIVDGKKYSVPPLEQPVCSDGNKIEDKDIEISKGKQVFGTIKDITLLYADENVPEDLNGIAINVRGQTIKRWLPPLMGHQAKRFSGFCKADFLKKSELPNHSGFKAKDDAWRESKEMIERRIREFMEPRIKSDMTVDPKQQKLANDMLEEINKTLEFFDELNPETLAMTEPVPDASRDKRQRNEVYISSLVSDKGGDYVRGDVVQLTSKTVNPFPVERKGYKESIRITDPFNSPVFSGSKDLEYLAKEQKESTYQFKIPEQGKTGPYLAVAILTNPEGKQASHRSLILNVEYEPVQTKMKETQKRLDGEEKPKETETGNTPDKQERKKKGLRLLKMVHSKPLEQNPSLGLEWPESILLPDTMTELIIDNHPAAKYAANRSATKNGALKYHIFKCAIDDVLKLWAKRKFGDIKTDDITPSTLEKMADEIFEMKRRLFARWTTLYN